MTRIAFCDDNLDELNQAIRLLNDFRAARNFTCEYAASPNGFELLAALEKGFHFDLYCLDILMPGFSGIETARAIRELDKAATIVFFTSSPEFALEGYSVRAANYILKPLTKEKLFAALDELLEQMPQKRGEDALVVQSTEGIQRILISNLVYTEVVGRNVLYHLVSSRVVTCAQPFSAACERLMKFGCFVQPHRSYIANMQHVDTIENSRLTMRNKMTVPIAQGKARDVRQKYLTYQMEGLLTAGGIP